MMTCQFGTELQRMKLVDRDAFRSRVDVRSESECWNWKGSICSGYGRFYVKLDKLRHVQAHRVMWWLEHGKLPKEALDHLCENKRCVNVRHLQDVTSSANVMRGKSAPALNARKTHCLRGHEFTPENTYLYPDDSRGCMECRRQCVRGWRQKQGPESGEYATERSAKGLVCPLRKILSEGPATVRELAAELGVKPRQASLAVWVLTHSGHAESVGAVATQITDRGDVRHLKLYALTKRGECAARKDLK